MNSKTFIRPQENIEKYRVSLEETKWHSVVANIRGSRHDIEGYSKTDALSKAATTENFNDFVVKIAIPLQRSYGLTHRYTIGDYNPSVRIRLMPCVLIL